MFFGIYNLTPLVLTDKDQAQPQFDASANLKVALQGGAVASGATDSGNPVKVSGVYNSTQPTFTTGQRGDLQIGSRGSLRVEIFGVGTTTGVGVGSASDGQAGQNCLFVVNQGQLFNGSTWDRAKKANAVARIASAAATTNGTVVKASAGEIHHVSAYNTTAAVKYLKIYNKTTAPTVGTDAPVLTLAIPPNGALSHGFANGGIYFATGISCALTGAAADADTTALTAGDVVGLNISYS